MGGIFNYPQFQALDGNGNPLNAGKLYSYKAGTSTAQVTYSDKACTAGNANANPTILNSRGEATIYLKGSYKFILKDSDDVTIWTLDTIDSTQPFANTALRVLDTDAATATAHYLTIKPGSNLSANKTLTITTGDANRTLTLTADTSLGGVLDEDDMASNSATAVPSQQSVKAYTDFLRRGYVERAQFVYNDANTIFINPGVYDIGFKMARWDTQLTSADIGTPTASTWVYLYLDYSAITSSTLITTSELIWSETAPSLGGVGWFNGNDRCIFAVYSDGSQNISEFHHAGNTVMFADQITSHSTADPGTDFATSTTLTIPRFTTLGIVTGVLSYADGADTARWKTKGQTGTGGHVWGNVANEADYDTNQFNVITDSSQAINHKVVATNNTVALYTAGWKFPTGM